MRVLEFTSYRTELNGLCKSSALEFESVLLKWGKER